MATLPVEETESSEEIEGLVYKRLEGRYRGWRVELLEEQPDKQGGREVPTV